VYVLMNDPRDKKGEIPPARKTILSKVLGKALIRINSNVSCHAILVDPTSKSQKGLILNKELLDFGNQYKENPVFLQLALNKDQIADFYSFFKNLFWMGAEKEILTEKDLSPQRDEKPVSLKTSAITTTRLLYDFKDCTYLTTSVRDSLANAVDSVQIAFENGIPPRLEDLVKAAITRTAGRNSVLVPMITWPQEQFSSINVNSNSTINDYPVFTFPVDFSFISIDSKTGFLFLDTIEPAQPKPGKYYLGIKLDAQQTKMMLGFLSFLTSMSEFEYYSRKSLAEIKNEIRILQDGNFIKPDLAESEQIILQDVKTNNIDEFLKRREETPNLKSFKKKFKRTIYYSWNVIPPILPDGSKEDQIYQAWDDLDSKFHAYFTRLVDAIDSLVRYMNANETERVKLIFLGTNQKLKEIRDVVQTCQITDVKGSSIKDIQKSIGILEQQYRSFIELQTRVQIALRNDNRINKLINESKAIHDQIGEQNNEIGSYHKQIHDNEEKLKEKQDERLELEKILKKKKKKDEDDTMDKLKENDLLINSIKDEINDARSSVEKLEKKNADNEKKIVEIEKEVKKLSTALESGAIEADSPGIGESLKELLASRQKKEKNEPAPGEILDKSESKFDGSIPKDPLPSTGRLYSVKKDRYLAIQYYSEIESGKKEASRLGAKLVSFSKGY
nr:hypothetical protein [Candidatus Sigynarchaeota archaeon]